MIFFSPFHFHPWNLKLSSLSHGSLHAQHKKCVHYGMKGKLLVFVFNKLRFVYLQYKSWWKINHNLYQQEERTKNWKQKRAKSFCFVYTRVETSHMHNKRAHTRQPKERTSAVYENKRA